ncbi:alpha/beta fold hydrolase [Curtobacterium sp. AB7]|uniref:alpha/beta fold hydrolase n=1 Tax=Curtobacterium sp. AB7 TaxID=3349327 RepID=UPI003835FF16
MVYTPHEPYRTSMIAVDGGASISCEESGTADGVPALWLHGGPGGSLGSGWYRTHFDPARYRLVGIDQRGAGRSRTPEDDLAEALVRQTTQQLIDDIEAVRTTLGIDTWVVAGISWGTTLALAYAQRHPERVRALALVAVTTTSRSEVDWITEGIGRLFPAEWDEFERASHRRPDERVVDAYARQLASPDARVREAAAAAWDHWENVHVSLDHPELRGHGHVGPARREAFARLVTHYWSNDAFLPGDQAVLARLDRIRHIPTTLVHGRRDVSGPVVTAWRLHAGLPESTLTIVEDEGHGGPEQSDVLSRALDQHADRTWTAPEASAVI